MHHITLSHVQKSQLVQTPQTGRNGAAELIVGEVPDVTARGSMSGGSVVYCDDTWVLGVLDLWVNGVCEINVGGSVSVYKWCVCECVCVCVCVCVCECVCVCNLYV